MVFKRVFYGFLWFYRFFSFFRLFQMFFLVFSLEMSLLQTLAGQKPTGTQTF